MARVSSYVLVLGADTGPTGSSYSVEFLGGESTEQFNVRGVELKLASVNGGNIDLVLANGDLVMDTGLATSVIASIWTDRRGTLEDELGPNDDPRGYWADRDGDRWGSRLWLLDRAKALDGTLRLAELYAAESLAWMRRIGMAQSVRAKAAWLDRGHLRVDVTVEPDARPRWAELWRGTDEDSARTPYGDATRLLFN